MYLLGRCMQQPLTKINGFMSQPWHLGGLFANVSQHGGKNGKGYRTLKSIILWMDQLLLSSIKRVFFFPPLIFSVNMQHMRVCSSNKTINRFLLSKPVQGLPSYLGEISK